MNTKRIGLFVVFSLALVFAAALLNLNRTTSNASQFHLHGQDPQHATHQPNSQSQQKPPAINGTVTPAAIPNHAAQEVVLRLLASDTPDQIGDRKKAYLRAYGFNEDAQAALMLAARDYKRLVAPVEQAADEIKNRTWPNPNSSVRAQLNQLQRDKEAVIATVNTDLYGRLQAFRSIDKWTDHVSHTVKQKMKGYIVELPSKKVGFLRHLPDPFAVFAQAAGCDPVYIYADAVYDNSSYLIYGYSSYSAGANNCGHDYYPTTLITHTGAPTASGSDYAVFNLDSGSGYYYDGFFSSSANIEGYCPVATVTFPAGTNSDAETVAPFLRIRSASLPTGITDGGNPNLTYEVSGSFSVNGLTGTLDIVGVGVVNITSGSIPNRQIPYQVNGGVRTHALGSITLVGSATTGQMAIQVSFTNCTPPTGAPQGTTFDGGCSKETNVMNVTK